MKRLNLENGPLSQGRLAMFRRYVATCGLDLIGIIDYLLMTNNARELIGTDELLEYSLTALYINKCSVYQMLLHTDLADSVDPDDLKEMSEIIQDRIICSTLEIRHQLEDDEDIVGVSVKCGRDIHYQIENQLALKEYIEKHERELEEHDMAEN